MPSCTSLLNYFDRSATICWNYFNLDFFYLNCFKLCHLCWNRPRPLPLTVQRGDNLQTKVAVKISRFSPKRIIWLIFLLDFHPKTNLINLFLVLTLLKFSFSAATASSRARFWDFSESYNAVNSSTSSWLKKFGCQSLRIKDGCQSLRINDLIKDQESRIKIQYQAPLMAKGAGSRIGITYQGSGSGCQARPRRTICWWATWWRRSCVCSSPTSPRNSATSSWLTAWFLW